MNTSLPDMLIPQRRYFGLSVGRTSLRAVEVQKNGKVRSYAEVFLPDGTFADNVLARKDYFIDALKKVLAAGKFTTPYVAISFSEIYAYSRECELPKVPLNELDEAVNWQVGDLFPFPKDEIYTNWKILEETEKTVRVVIVAVPKKMLDPLVDALITTGLKPLGFEPGASIIARILKLALHQQAIVVQINRKGAYVTLVEGEKALFTTVVNYVKEESSETYVQNISQTIVEITDYYKKKKILVEQNLRVIVTGELATNEWTHSIQAKCAYPVSILVTQIGKPAFNKAYAVAISQIYPPKDPRTINLLPQELQKKYDDELQNSFHTNLFFRMIGSLIILCVVSIVVFVLISVQRQGFESRVKTLTNRAKTQQNSQTQGLLSLNAQARTIVALAPLRQTPKDKLAVIESILTPTITISQWEYVDSTLMYTLVGTAATRSDLLDLKTKLEESGEFTKVTLPLESLEVPENAHFVISFVVKK